jgi:hypothetical protein
MAMPVAGGRQKMDLANLGTAQVLDLLGPSDEFGVIAVDSAPHIIQPLGLIRAKGPVRDKILKINSEGGGIFIFEALEASLAMLKSPKKQPQKEFKQDEKEDKVGVNNDPTKVIAKQCCTSEADCNAAALAFPTNCAEGLQCENNRCIRPKKDKPKPDDKDKPVTIPDRTANEDDPKGKPTENTIGAFDGSKHGLAKTNSGDPWFARLNNDFFSFLEFPKLEQASAAQPCVRITADGKISETEFKKQSDNEGLNGKIGIALTKLKEQRTTKPEAVPTHLLKDVTTQWTCFSVDNQTRQQD